MSSLSGQRARRKPSYLQTVFGRAAREAVFHPTCRRAVAWPPDTSMASALRNLWRARVGQLTGLGYKPFQSPPRLFKVGQCRWRSRSRRSCE
jgi:hypothetical protein